jgi:hypothetical protein
LRRDYDLMTIDRAALMVKAPGRLTAPATDKTQEWASCNFFCKEDNSLSNDALGSRINLQRRHQA